MRAAVFDLGDTLVEYEGLPLSWEAYYGAALGSLAMFCRLSPTESQVKSACEVLRRYNTRLFPRSVEFTFETQILPELIESLGGSFQGPSESIVEAFFSVFRQRLRCFPESVARLEGLRKDGVRVGILTDVPYGMPRRLVLEDISSAGILSLIDEVVTSVDAEVRKPSTAGLALLASRLDSTPSEMMYVGNERKDVEVAIAFGCEAVLLHREGIIPDWKQHRTVSSLDRL